MKEAKKRLKSEGGRGTYVRQACNHCRRRKSKCDGQEPVCGPCRDSGRAAECTWGKETAKKARTQQHFESLVNHIKSLELRVKELEGDLKRAKGEEDLPEPGPSNFPDSLANSTYKPEPEDPVAAAEAIQSSASSAEDSDIEQLVAPTKNLVLQGGNELQVYGPSSAYRMAPEQLTDRLDNHDQSAIHSLHIDWARHLPPDALMSREEHDKCLDRFFKFFCGWCFRLIQDFFVRDMHRALSLPPNQRPPKSAHYSPMLHNAIFSMAIAFSDDPMLRVTVFREKFANKAKSYYDTECENPNIPLVMALSLLASYHATIGLQGLGYIYFGMSGRVAQALGLGVDCEPWVKSGIITSADARDRSWAYWGTFVQDVCWSLYVGRDRGFISEKDDRDKIPVPFVGSEIDRAPWVSNSHCKFPLQSNNVASIFAASCDLLKIADRVTDFVNGLGKDWRRTNMQMVSELDIELNAWKDSLPPEIDLSASSRPVALPHRLTLHMTYWWLLILLHRPFYRRSRSHMGVDIDHVKLANRAAENIVLIAGNWNTNYCIRFCPITIVQIIFSASTVFILSAIQAISGPRLGRVTLTTSLNHIQDCIDYLGIIGESWLCANSVRDILLNMLDTQLRPRLQLRQGEAGLKSTILPSASSRSSASPPAGRGDDSDERSSASPSLSSNLTPTPPSGSPSSLPYTPTESSYSDWHTINGGISHLSHHPQQHQNSPNHHQPQHQQQQQAHHSRIHNPYITANPIFPTTTNSGMDHDMDMEMNMNFTGLPVDFVLPALAGVGGGHLTNSGLPQLSFGGGAGGLGVGGLHGHSHGHSHSSPVDYHRGGPGGGGGGGPGVVQQVTGSGQVNAGGTGPSTTGVGVGQQGPGGGGALQFSEEEMAMMERIVRQQQQQQQQQHSLIHSIR